MANIYEIADRYKNIQELLENPEIERGVIYKALAEIDGELDEKVEIYCQIIKNFKAQAAGCDEEAKRLTARKKSFENAAARMTDYMAEALQHAGKEKVKTKLFSVGFQKNPPSVDILSLELLPKEYFKEPVPPEADKAHILEDLKAGKAVPGAAIKQGVSIRIR